MDLTEEIQTNEDLKVIQILLDDEGLPTIQYKNLNTSEVVGALDLAKEIISTRRITLRTIKEAFSSV